jgi:apolipoprotein D and lipocalin family protein
MQFVWPVEAEYRVVYLDADYSQTVIGRSKRDYVWIMARTPEIPAADYARLVALVGELGYDVTQLVPVPQRW